MTQSLARFVIAVHRMRKLQSDYEKGPRESLRRDVVQAEQKVDDLLKGFGFIAANMDGMQLDLVSDQPGE